MASFTVQLTTDRHSSIVIVAVYQSSIVIVAVYQPQL